MGLSIYGRAYDQDDCERLDLLEGTVVLTTDEGTICPIEFANNVGYCDELVFQTGGTHTITASYDGGGVFDDATVTTEVIVEKISSTTEITYHYPDPAQLGRALEVAVEVSGPGLIPTGQVQVSAGGGSCTIELDDGRGNCTLIPVEEGSTTITAEYEGDETYNPSSTTSDATVGPAMQNTVTNIINIDGDSDPSCPEPLPVYVTVRVSGAGGTPTGTVSVTGADVQNCQITLSGGTGTCTLYFSNKYQDDTPVYATYSGDASFYGSSASRIFDACQ